MASSSRPSTPQGRSSTQRIALPSSALHVSSLLKSVVCMMFGSLNILNEPCLCGFFSTITLPVIGHPNTAFAQRVKTACAQKCHHACFTYVGEQNSCTHIPIAPVEHIEHNDLLAIGAVLRADRIQHKQIERAEQHKRLSLGIL